MPRQLATRLNAVAPSVTLAMNARAMELKARGVDVFAFGVGEPDFEPPQAVLDAAKKAIDAGCSKYTAVTGIPPLKEAICDFTQKTRGWRPEPKNVCVTVGAKHALFNLALALYEPGDEVVIPKPYWVSYPEQVRMMGATPVLVDTREEEGWKVSPGKLEAALGPRTKAVILCTPSNPTGAAYTEDETRALLDVVRRHDCWLVVDEIYAELVYEGFRFVSAARLAPDLHDRLVIVDGVSKTFAMTGWRIGWALAPPALIKALDLVQGQSTTNAAAVAQQAALAAMRSPIEDFARIRAMFERRRDAMVSGLESVPGVRCRKPEGAFYAFADVRGLFGLDWGSKAIETDEDVAFWLLDRAHVAAVPGSGFGAPGYLRVSYAASEERIAAGVAAIRQVVDQAWRADRTGRTKVR
ncbi:MAG TPA: pyridoxal phosphate-dependent aminotransferase [Polyangiaceae bacterium]